jgi:aryl-alcohol dehydrogenase-like predicted oxidoreductase
MLYRTHQSITLSEIGLGCYALSGAYGQKDLDQYRKMLLDAIESGVTFFDTADTYGDLAETFLGEVIHPYRKDIILATKIGMRDGKKADLSREAVIAACEASLQRLNTDWIDLYQVHYDDPCTPVEETVAALESLVENGKIRRYGIGHLPMDRIHEYLERGRVFSGQFELSAVARDTQDEIVPLLQTHDAGLIAFSVTGRGLLSGRLYANTRFEPGDIRNIDPLFQRERLRSSLRIASKFSRLGKIYGKSAVQVAIAWVLSQPGVICALTGPSTCEHLMENLGGSGWQISNEHLDMLNVVFLTEDHALRVIRNQTLCSILENPLSADSGKSIRDLIYVIETAITSGWIDQQMAMPIFLSVNQCRKEMTTDPNEILENARLDLADLLKGVLNFQTQNTVYQVKEF